METSSDTMAATTFSTPRKASNSKTTVRASDTQVASVMSFWLVAISSFSSTGEPVSPAVTPLNSGSFFSRAICARMVEIAAPAGTKPTFFRTGSAVRICWRPALAKAESEDMKKPSSEGGVPLPPPKLVKPAPACPA